MLCMELFADRIGYGSCGGTAGQARIAYVCASLRSAVQEMAGQHAAVECMAGGDVATQVVHH